jgi:hypothetical protein
MTIGYRREMRSLAAATSRQRPCCHRPNDPLEIGVRSGGAVDWHMLIDIELEPLEIAEQRNGVGIDVRQVHFCGRRPVVVRAARS